MGTGRAEDGTTLALKLQQVFGLLTCSFYWTFCYYLIFLLWKKYVIAFTFTNKKTEAVIILLLSWT